MKIADHSNFHRNWEDVQKKLGKVLSLAHVDPWVQVSDEYARALGQVVEAVRRLDAEKGLDGGFGSRHELYSSEKQGEGAMNRERLTGHSREAAEVLKEIEAVEKGILAVDDAGLDAETDALAKKEKEIVTTRDVGVTLKDEGDQNAKANANWPITDAERMTVATQLVKFAKMLMND